MMSMLDKAAACFLAALRVVNLGATAQFSVVDGKGVTMHVRQTYLQ